MTTPTGIPSPITSKIIETTSGNLFQVAAEEMGDATRWNDIADLNGMLDPFFIGSRKLKIPSGKRPGNGGIRGM